MSRSLESVGLGLTGAIVESLRRLGGDDGERTEGLARVSIEVEREGGCGVFEILSVFLSVKIFSEF